jgi:hypothetical protein
MDEPALNAHTLLCIGFALEFSSKVQVRSGKVEQIRSCASCETRCKDRLFLGICGKKHEKVKEAALIDAVSRWLEVIFGMI